MTGQWGPQANGGVQMQKRGGGHWVVFAVLSVFVLIARIGGGFDTLIVLLSVLAVPLGYAESRKGGGFAYHRWFSVTAVLLLATYPMLGYAVGYVIGKALGERSLSFRSLRRTPTEREEILASPVASSDILDVSARAWGRPGGAHIGWTDKGTYLGANPRGGVLVIGPPGSGKSAGIIIPSIHVSPGAAVVSTIKMELLVATAAARSAVGSVFHFDPGGNEQTPPGVIQARWSPLVSIRTWDDARIVANRLATPAMKDGDGNHFVERARDWLEVLLYAAVIGGYSISDVADWSQNPDSKEVTEEVDSQLIFAAGNGDKGARIAVGEHAGLLATPDKERGSVKTTLNRLLRIYGSVTARELGTDPNFNPRAFVRSSDTLYITASPERQKEYAPLIAGLLEEIRFATYERHTNEEQGLERKSPHVTFVLDEANNTAPIPLPDIISEAGGQSLHLIVGIQDLSRARERWGRAADGFLTLFPTKIILNGVVEPYTLDALSNAAGEYDRLMTSYSESTTYIGKYHRPVRQQNPSWSTTRQKVLHQGDIAKLPEGKALLFEGADWALINIGMHFSDPVWQHVQRDAIAYANRRVAAEGDYYISELPSVPRELES